MLIFQSYQIEVKLGLTQLVNIIYVSLHREVNNLMGDNCVIRSDERLNVFDAKFTIAQPRIIVALIVLFALTRRKPFSCYVIRGIEPNDLFNLVSEML